jgi:predicted dehydrogenase
MTQLRIGLIGCGQIADAHLQELRHVEAADVVAVCDRHIDLARQAAARFEVPAAFDSVSDMLQRARPDVVHITTPPHTHRALAVQCLQGGAHVYVEKPFTVNVEEADVVLETADRHSRFVCLGHDQLFDPAWQACRELSRRGALGEVVHVEATQGYDLNGPFGRVLMANPSHWVHQLPGGLFQNVMSHALARILDFLPDDAPEVRGYWFAGRGASFPTELRVLLRGRDVTGTLTFTSMTRPSQKIARVYGTRMAVDVDLDARVVRRHRAPTAPSALAKVQLPWWHLTDAAANWSTSVRRLYRSDLRFFAGMQELFRQFYHAIQHGGPLPVAHADARRLTAIMDRIFDECAADANGSRAGRPMLVAAK